MSKNLIYGHFNAFLSEKQEIFFVLYKDFEKIFTTLCQKQSKSQAIAPFSMLFAVKIAVRDLCGEAVCAQTGAGWRWRNLEWIRSQTFVSLSQKQNRKPLRRSPFRQIIRRGSNSAKKLPMSIGVAALSLNIPCEAPGEELCRSTEALLTGTFLF